MLNMEQIFEYLRKEYRSSPPDPVFYRKPGTTGTGGLTRVFTG